MDDDYWNHFQWPLNPARNQSKPPPGCCRKEGEVREVPLSKHRWCCLPRKDRGPEVFPVNTGKGFEAFDDLWDVDDPAFLDKVGCKALVKIISVDPKNSSFQLRLKCKWKFRTLHGDERTETKLRVPGLRLPGLIVEVEESRIWKDLEATKKSDHTVFW